MWSEVAEVIGSGDSGEDADSGEGADNGESAVTEGHTEGTAIEIGRNEVWETVFVGDEIIKYVDSSFSRKDC